jgi:hypothetical protein
MKITNSLLRSLIAEEIQNTTEIHENLSSQDLAAKAATFVDDLLEAGVRDSQITGAISNAIRIKRAEKKDATSPAGNRKDIQEMGCGSEPQMPEPTHHSEDHEGSMAKRQMFKTAEYAAIIFDMLHDDEELPAWIQSKLTKIADYIGVVKHYLEYDKMVDNYPANREDWEKEQAAWPVPKDPDWENKELEREKRDDEEYERRMNILRKMLPGAVK